MHVAGESKVRDATWAVAYGIALWGLTGDTDAPRRGNANFTEAGKMLKRFFRQFLP